MAKMEHKLTCCMITQQTDTQYFSDWSEEELKHVENADITGIMSVIGHKLQERGYMAQEMHGILHDEDTREVWDDVSGNYVIDLKARHFHIAIKFLKYDKVWYSGTLPQVAAAIGLEPQYVEKAGKGKYAYDNMVSYLIHIKYPEKHQYSPKKVVSMGAVQNGEKMYTGYMAIYKERKKVWEDGRAKIKAQQAQIGIDNLEEMILLGEVSKNQVLLTDSYFEIYARNKRRCEDAFDTYAQRKIAKTIQAMENGEFKVSVFFVTGRSHSGKSIFTDCLVEQIRNSVKAETGDTWGMCSCAATNPFDEYNGEEILVMDDLRGLALTASDWLKLLDPDRINTGSARYRNKKIACRAIIINSEKDVVEFFYYLKGSGGDRSEALDQFFRRIMARIIVYRVPDTDTRRISVGEMKETTAYKIDSPSSDGGTLTLHHKFEHGENTRSMEYNDALNYLTKIVIDNNKFQH